MMSDEIIEIEEDISSIPNSIIIIPPTISVILTAFLNFDISFTNTLMNIDVKKNGKPSPNEYVPSKTAPRIGLPSYIVRPIIPPSIGPMQGVQPKAKAIPINKDTKYPPFKFDISALFS